MSTSATDWQSEIDTITSRHKITRAALAERIGVTRSAVSDWANGRRVPPRSVSKLLQLMKAGNNLKKLK